MDQTTIEDLRRRLSDEQAGLTTQLMDLGIDPVTGVPSAVEFEQGFADSGQATAEKVRLLSITEGLVETLREVEAALARMEKGTYGRCEECGREIPPERLEARPFARLCVECKKRSG